MMACGSTSNNFNDAQFIAFSASSGVYVVLCRKPSMEQYISSCLDVEGQYQAASEHSSWQQLCHTHCDTNLQLLLRGCILCFYNPRKCCIWEYNLRQCVPHGTAEGGQRLLRDMQKFCQHVSI